MNRYAFLAAALAGALFAPPAAAPAQAASATIQRCASADGSIAYTDKGCGVFGNDAVMLQSQVVGYPVDPAEASTSAGLAPARSSAIAAPGRRSAASGCARTPTQLQMDLRGAFALGDVNRIAESYHWVGLSTGQARAAMDRLQGLAAEPVLDAQYYGATLSSGAGGAQWVASAGGAGGGQAGMLQLVMAGDGNASVVAFDVHRYKDCYFVSF